MWKSSGDKEKNNSNTKVLCTSYLKLGGRDLDFVCKSLTRHISWNHSAGCKSPILVFVGFWTCPSLRTHPPGCNKRLIRHYHSSDMGLFHSRHYLPWHGDSSAQLWLGQGRGGRLPRRGSTWGSYCLLVLLFFPFFLQTIEGLCVQETTTQRERTGRVEKKSCTQRQKQNKTSVLALWTTQKKPPPTHTLA